MAKHMEGVDVCPSCEEKMAVAHKDLVKLFRRMKHYDPTVHISWTHRGQTEQMEAFNSGASKLPWPQSRHNKKPAEAMDVFQIIEGRAVFDPIAMAKLNVACAQHEYRWGGDFKSLGDSGHFEIQDL